MKREARSLRNAALAVLTSALAISCGVQAQSTLGPNIAPKFAFGKSVFIKNAHGGNVPYEAITADMEGWGRFTLVSSPDQADFVVEVTSYEGGSVTPSSRTEYAPNGKPQSSSGASKDLSGSSVTMRIFEPKTGRDLWNGTEEAKGALKKKSEEDNMLAATEKLFRRFHDAVEPPGK
ncbi:MAG: hypothetical protein JOZ44_15800 [Acidobacteria bacterium]|nr:hypothetical protein [Acidobacteriota bacterium]